METDITRLALCEKAVHDLRVARTWLRKAGASQAADAVARALKSADGAVRNAKRFAADLLEDPARCAHRHRTFGRCTRPSGAAGHDNDAVPGRRLHVGKHGRQWWTKAEGR